jgi:hypothetical protein
MLEVRAHPPKGAISDATLARSNGWATWHSPRVDAQPPEEDMADSMSPICQAQMAEERIKRDALTRLREAAPADIAAFAGKLRREAREAGASESDLHEAENEARQLVDA